jgi:hypothetical protein
MQKTLQLIFSFLFLANFSFSQSVGDLIFVGYNGDGNDDISLVAMATIPANTTIYLRDDEWNGTGWIDALESSFAWNLGPNAIPAGTILTMNSITISPSVNFGSVTAIGTNNTGYSSGGEAVFVYTGTDVNTPTTFLTALCNGDPATSFGTLNGTGLGLGTTAIRMATTTLPTPDIGVYKGPKSGNDKSGFISLINDMANWDLQDGSGDQSIDGMVPDLPFSMVPFSFGGSDITPPTVVNVSVFDQSKINIQFSEAITYLPSDFVLVPNIPIVSITNITNNGVQLTLVNPMTTGAPYKIEIKNVKDIAGNTILPFTSQNLFWNPYQGTDLVISEINYNPFNVGGANTDSIEFIEIFNKGTTPIALGGLEFTRGIIGTLNQASLGPKQAIAVASDSIRSKRFYGGNFQQWRSDFLSNGGELIYFSNSRGNIIDSVLYDDVSPWPTAADGTGYSLELIDPNIDNNVATNWKISSTPTGKSISGSPIFASPGRLILPTQATIAFLNSSITISEDAGQATIPINLTGTGTSNGDVEIFVSSGTASSGTDYTFTSPQKINVVAGATQVASITIPIANDSDIESDEYFVLRFRNANNLSIGSENALVVFIRDNDFSNPIPNDSLSLELIASYKNPNAGSSEIISFDRNTKRMFIANSIGNRIEIVNMENPAAPVAITGISLAGFGSINSIASFNGIVAAAVEATALTDNGTVRFYNTNGDFLKSVEVGNLPDHIIFSPDGKTVMTANEGQPQADYVVDPEGSISIIDISGGIANLSQSNVTTLRFNNFNSFLPQLRSGGLRIFGPKVGQPGGSNLAEDLEPEFITFSEDGKTAYVSCQENNAIVIVDVVNKKIVTNPNNFPSIIPLGLKNHGLAGNGFDASDRSTGINLTSFSKLFGVYMPDGLSAFSVGGKNYFASANEGDAREYTAYDEQATVKTLRLDPSSFPDSLDLRLDALLGRLKLTKASGDTDGDGDYDFLASFGSRSFTIWDEAGKLVWDSGDEIERFIRSSTTWSRLFNANNSSPTVAVKNRSDDKGPEPEGVTTAAINGKTYAFVGLERIGGIIVYNITNVNKPQLVTYANNRTGASTDDLGPEGIVFVPANQSPNGQNLLLLANEISNSVSIFRVVDKTRPNSTFEGMEATSFSAFPNPASNTLNFTRPITGSFFDLNGREVVKFVETNEISTQQLTNGMYFLRSENGEYLKIVIQK